MIPITQKLSLTERSVRGMVSQMQSAFTPAVCLCLYLLFLAGPSSLLCYFLLQPIPSKPTVRKEPEGHKNDAQTEQLLLLRVFPL